MKSVLKIIVLILMVKNISAQQVVMFNHYFYKPMVYNPAFTGNITAPEAMLINHTQWTSFKGAPQYNLLTFDGNFINKNTGLGVMISSDKKGVNSRVGGNISYSYKVKFKKNIHLLLGLSAGAINQSINYSNAVIENSNDPSLFTNSQNKTTFDINAGLAFICKGLEFGFALPQLANNKINYVSNTAEQVSYRQSRHYMGSVKYNFLVSKQKEITLSPLFLMRYVPNAPTQFDANVNLNWANKFWVGATYKKKYAVGLNLGVTLFKRLSIGYSYDYITGSVSKYSGLSHEIMLSFKFIKPKKDSASVVKTEDELLNKMAKQDLNKLIIEQLKRKVELLLDKENLTHDEIQGLLDEIASFLDDESNDPLQEVLNKYYNSLKLQAQGEFNVLIKGKIIFDDNELNGNYQGTSITVTDFNTKKVVATSKPSVRDGKYYIILKPGKKYLVTVETEGYPKYMKDFSVAATKESYELSQEIHLKK